MKTKLVALGALRRGNKFVRSGLVPLRTLTRSGRRLADSLVFIDSQWPQEVAFPRSVTPRRLNFIRKNHRPSNE